MQPAEELGLIDGIDQVEAYIQRNYGDQARLQLYCCCWDERFFSQTALSKRNNDRKISLNFFQKMTLTMKWIMNNFFLIHRDKLKGHGNEADFLGFLQKSVRHRFLTLHFEPFRFGLGIRGDIRNRKTTPRIA
jgi:hypothetical protein